MEEREPTNFEKFKKSKWGIPVACLLSLFVGLLLLWMGVYGNICITFAIPVLMYIILKVFGVENIKILVGFGVGVFIILTLFGAFAISKPMIDSYNGQVQDETNFKDITLVDNHDGTYTLTATYKGDASKYHGANLHISGVNQVYYLAYQPSGWTEMGIQTDKTVTWTIKAESGKLYCYYISMYKDDTHKTIDYKTKTYFGPNTMNDQETAVFVLGGNTFFAGVYITLPILLISVLVWFMRQRLEKTRERMEKEGRLYPQGYGRCKGCGTIVLPGEENCRKCGIPVDVPDELKPKKKDVFECSDCGKVVPSDAGVCPYCGSVFEADTDVSDGELNMIQCPNCSQLVSADSKFCPQCGTNFDKKE